MGDEKRKIKSGDVTLGMYVTQLDRAWEMTPFPVHGFYVRDLSEIKLLKMHCEYIVIDIKKGEAPLDNIYYDDSSKSKQPRLKLAPLKVNSSVYAAVDSIKTEMPKAEQAYQRLLDEVELVMHQAKNNCLLSITQLIQVSKEVVESVVRNPDAFMWWVRLRDNNTSPVSYIVREVMWSMILGRYLGLARGELSVLVLGVSLKNIGKTQLPKESFDSPSGALAYINLSVEMLRKVPGVAPKVMNIVKTHAERINGSGFPLGLVGDDIFLLGKIAGIADFYDHVIHPSHSLYPISPSQAVSRLYEVRGVEFQDELVVEFLRAIGLYATGTVVELSTEEIGVVVEQCSERRLKPKVMVILGADKQAVKKPYILDLYEYHCQRQKRMDAGKKNAAEKLEVIKDLELEEYALDLELVRQQFVDLHTKKSRFSFFKS